MSLRIGTNIVSLSAGRSLTRNNRDFERSASALASGTRITSPGDDAAGFAISESFRAQERSLGQAINNTSQAKSFLQVAEGALNEQSNILVRLRELSVQAASDTVGDQEREYLQVESEQLVEEFDRIAKSTRFGQAQLLTGDGKQFEFFVGGLGLGASASTASENIIRYSIDSDTTANAVDLDRVDLAEKSQARDSLEWIDSASETISRARASFGSLQSRLDFASSHLESSRVSIASARSQISDTDVAKETSQLVRSRILQDIAIGVLAQANSYPERALRLLS